MDDRVIVFFSTCDSVEFHSLLFRESSWPEKIDDHFNAKFGVNQQNMGSEKESRGPNLFGNWNGFGGYDTDDSEGSGGGKTVQVSQHLESMRGSAPSNLFNGTEIFTLHGKISQEVRRKVFERFSGVKKGFLFCRCCS